MQTCRRGTDARKSGLVAKVATVTCTCIKERMSIDGLADLDQSLKDLEIDCTLETTPTIGVTGCFNTNNRLPRPARGGGRLNRAAGTAACGGTSGGGGGPERKFGSLALWAWVMPWFLLVLGGMEGVKGVAIPDCTYAAFGGPSCYSASCYNVRTCGIRQAVDTFDSVATIAKYGMVQDWDVSLVTDMSRVFFNKGTFNEDISKWEVGRVTNMAVSTYSESLPRSKLGSFLFASLLILIFNSMCLSVPLHPFPFDRWTSLCLVRSVLLRW